MSKTRLNNIEYFPTNHDNNKLLADIKHTQIALETAYSNFQNVVDPALIDCYIYELNAVNKRYEYLLAQARTMEVSGAFKDKGSIAQ